MWIRFIRWNAVSRLAPHVVRCRSGRMYQWDGTGVGAIEVPYRADVEDLLQHPNGRYTLAYERHGIAWDAHGRAETAAPAEVVEDEGPTRKGKKRR